MTGADVRRAYGIVALAAGLALLADQLSKAWVLNRFALGQGFAPFPALADYFQIIRSENRGVAFGFLGNLPNSGTIFTVLSLVIVVVLLFSYRAWAVGRGVLWPVCVGLIAGGALGNVIDRVRFGAVVDFINYRIPGVISNVSNLADHAIVLGVLLLLLAQWRAPAPPPPSPPAADDV